MPPTDRALLLTTWTTVVAWLLYGLAALATGGQPGAPLQPATDLPWQQLSVTVSMTSGDAAQKIDCTPIERQDGRYAGARCSAEVWHFVGPYADRANGAPMRCIWVHPPTDGKTLTLRWQAVDLGAAVSVTLALLPGSSGGADVTARVSVDGRLIGSLQTDHERTVAHLNVPVPAEAGPRTVSVSIHADNNRWRLACLQLLARVGAPGKAPTDGSDQNDE